MKNWLRQLGIIFTILAMTMNLSFLGTVKAAEKPEPFSYEAASLVIAGQDRFTPAIFWLKIIPGQIGLDQIIKARSSAGLEPGRFGAVDYVMCRVSVLPDRFIINEQIYFDGAGEVIADWERADWENAEQPGALLAGQALAVLPEYFINRNTNPPKGLCGIPWGSAPDALPGALLDETLVHVLRIYMADVDVTPLLGEVKQVKKAWLVFDAWQGLQRGVISFDGREYEKVLKRLTGLFGNPRGERSLLYWQLADDLRLELEVMEAFGMLHGTLEISNPNFASYERQLFRNKE